MLWLALHFPALALDVFARSAREPGALAVASSAGADAIVHACNRAAARRGVRPGMPLVAACALASGLRVVTRDACAERAALERIAAWAIQFTPVVSIAPPAEALLEVEGSLGLLGGLERLCRLVEGGVSGLGYGVRLACAPVPLAAQLLARAGLAARIRHHDALRQALEPLPLEALGQPPEVTAILRNAGVRTLGDCLRLPRAGLARRCGRRLLDDLDRALGRLPDPRPGFAPPARFTAALPLPAPAHEARALLFAARRLLAELCGYLAATGTGVQRLDLALAHEDRADTRLALNLVTATRDPGHLAAVLRERLARTNLPCQVTAISLAAESLAPLPSRNLSFLPAAAGHAETAARLIERLRGRLGEDAVRGLELAADYRPERAWRACEPGRAPDAGGGAVPQAPRPLWLLASPRPLGERAAAPCHDGPLALLAGPERIESGWWDGADVARDYFIARNPADSLLWIYRERRGDGAWYLHGFFG